MTLIVAVAGCALLLGPCGFYHCNDDATISEPPRDNPLSRAMASPIRFGTDSQYLTSIVRARYKALGRVWPTPLDCASIASPGCRYTVIMRYVKYNTCFSVTYDVTAEGPDDEPVVQVVTPPSPTTNRCKPA